MNPYLMKSGSYFLSLSSVTVYIHAIFYLFFGNWAVWYLCAGKTEHIPCDDVALFVCKQFLVVCVCLAGWYSRQLCRPTAGEFECSPCAG